MKKKVPEQLIVDTIKTVARKLSKKFRFGFYTEEDIEQEIAVLCLKSLDKYDESLNLA